MKNLKILTSNINWSFVNSFGKMKYSKSSYYFLVLIPILVKVSEYLSSEFDINITFPFNWYVFYFGALAIAFGSILYQLFCPPIIKKYSNYGEFIEAGESDSYLKRVVKVYLEDDEQLNILSLESPYIKEDEFIKKTTLSDLDPLTIPNFTTSPEIGVKTVFKHNLKYQEDRKNFFNLIYERINYFNKKIINTALISYLVGFTAFIWVIFQNILFVIERVFF